MAGVAKKPAAKKPDAPRWAPGKATDWLIDRFEKATPNFHLGGQVSWIVSSDTLRFLEKHVTPGARTLETGAGLSTVMFAALGADHMAICPSADEIVRIKGFCKSEGVSTARLDMRDAFSEDVLPALKTAPLDLVLVDGGHGFPMPAIDWYFAARHLKIGGVMVIDDTHLWSCGMLVDVMNEDPAWQAMGRIGRRTYAFRLVSAFSYKEFVYQPFVVRKSRLASVVTRALVAWDLMAAGDLKEFMKRALKR